MADVDKAGCPGFVVQFPSAIVSSSPVGVRTVVVRVGPSAPVLKTIEPAVSSGATNLVNDMSDLEKRLRGVETDVATIKERLTHMPTKLEMQSMLTSAQTKILLAIATLAIGAGLKWLWPVLFAGHTAAS